MVILTDVSIRSWFKRKTIEQVKENLAKSLAFLSVYGKPYHSRDTVDGSKTGYTVNIKLPRRYQTDGQSRAKAKEPRCRNRVR